MEEVVGSNPTRVTQFYGYKHWTLEAVPRCFYVGKGQHRRPWSQARSSKWKAVVLRYGLRVEVCIGPVSNEEVSTWEADNILSENTRSNVYHLIDDDINCNFTDGGDGVPGRKLSSAAKEAIGNAQRGKPKSVETKQKLREALTGRALSTITRQRMSEAKKGKPLSKKNRQNLWANRSRQFSDDHRQNLSRAAKTRKCSVCRQTGHKRPTCPLAKEGD